jgi:hypothetical protein
MIERLTDEEREDLGCLARAEIRYYGVEPEPQPCCAKALRIIDAQAKLLIGAVDLAQRVVEWRAWPEGGTSDDELPVDARAFRDACRIQEAQ